MANRSTPVLLCVYLEHIVTRSVAFGQDRTDFDLVRVNESEREDKSSLFAGEELGHVEELVGCWQGGRKVEPPFAGEHERGKRAR